MKHHIINIILNILIISTDIVYCVYQNIFLIIIPIILIAINLINSYFIDFNKEETQYNIYILKGMAGFLIIFLNFIIYSDILPITVDILFIGLILFIMICDITILIRYFANTTIFLNGIIILCYIIISILYLNLFVFIKGIWLFQYAIIQVFVINIMLYLEKKINLFK